MHDLNTAVILGLPTVVLQHFASFLCQAATMEGLNDQPVSHRQHLDWQFSA